MFDTSRVSRKAVVTHENMLNDLTTQMSKLASMCTGSRRATDFIVKTIAAEQKIEAFSLSFQYLPKQLQSLNMI